MPISFFDAVHRLQAGSIGNYAADLVIFLFKMSEYMWISSMDLYIYKGVCLQTLESGYECEHLDMYPEKENSIQAKAGQYIMGYKILMTVPVVFMLTFFGAWSDRTGRKIPVMLNCFGSVLFLILVMASSCVGGRTGPYLPLVLIGTATKGFLGHIAVMDILCYSYVVDTTSEDKRTTRLAFVYALGNFGSVIGSMMVGPMLDILGFDAVFCVAVFILTVCFMVATLCMRHTAPEKDSKSTSETETSSAKSWTLDRLCELFSGMTHSLLTNIKYYVMSIFILDLTIQFCKFGELAMMLLYVKHEPLSWKDSLYAYYLAVDTASTALMAFVCLPVLVYCCKPDDEALALAGFVFKIIGTLMLAFSSQTWQIFMAVLVSSPLSFAIVGLTSMLSKVVNHKQIGLSLSIFYTSGIVFALVGAIIFLNIYTATLGLWRGFTFALEACCFGVMSLVLVVLTCRLTKEQVSVFKTAPSNTDGSASEGDKLIEQMSVDEK